MMPRPNAPEAAKLIWRRTHEHLIARTQFRRWGTGYGGYSFGNNTSSEPIRNWQEEWHDEKSIGGPMFETRFWVKKKWTDFNCTTNCMKVSCIKSGRWKGDITDMPDYELESHCGTNFGIFNAEEIIHLSTLCDLLGHSGINGMSAMSYAAELYQRGILTEKDIGFKLEWGDVDAFDRLMRMVAKREGIGDVIADGTYRAALKIAEMKGMKPEELLKYAVVRQGHRGRRPRHPQRRRLRPRHRLRRQRTGRRPHEPRLRRLHRHVGQHLRRLRRLLQLRLQRCAAGARLRLRQGDHRVPDRHRELEAGSPAPG